MSPGGGWVGGGLGGGGGWVGGGGVGGGDLCGLAVQKKIQKSNKVGTHQEYTPGILWWNSLGDTLCVTLPDWPGTPFLTANSSKSARLHSK